MTELVEDLVELSRLLVGVAYRSLDAAPVPLPLAQFRALTALAHSGPCTAGGLAEELDLPGSSATRLCDRLVAAGWVDRRTRAENRREVELTLTRDGRTLVDAVMTARAEELDRILARMPARARGALAEALPHLLEAADHPAHRPRAAWAV